MKTSEKLEKLIELLLRASEKSNTTSHNEYLTWMFREELRKLLES